MIELKSPYDFKEPVRCLYCKEPVIGWNLVVFAIDTGNCGFENETSRLRVEIECPSCGEALGDAYFSFESALVSVARDE